MRISGVELEDGGEYVCTAENRAGKQFASAVITVQGKTKIFGKTKSISILWCIGFIFATSLVFS